MALYQSTSNSAHHTTVAATVDGVILDAAYPLVEVINRDTASDLWVTVEHGTAESAQTGQDPAVGGDGCYYVGPGGVRTIAMVKTNGSPQTLVRLISAGAVAYSVTGLTS